MGLSSQLQGTFQLIVANFLSIFNQIHYALIPLHCKNRVGFTTCGFSHMSKCNPLTTPMSKSKTFIGGASCRTVRIGGAGST